MAIKAPHLTAPPLQHRLDEAEEYERSLAALQFRLVQIQQAAMRTGQRSIIVLEGWDAAGKGGMIRRMSAPLDPRFCHVIPIAEPKYEEQGRHYLYRFWRGLPLPGTITVFDRSWYGRVLVERVEGLISEKSWQRAYNEINQFEKMLVDDGIRLVKVFFHVSAEQQLKRFRQRLETPHKRWKLTISDLRNLEKRSLYERAINDMFARCHTPYAPWHMVASDFKWWARCEALSIIVGKLDDGVDLAPPPRDPEIVRKLDALLRTTGIGKKKGTNAKHRKSGKPSKKSPKKSKKPKKAKKSRRA